MNCKRYLENFQGYPAYGWDSDDKKWWTWALNGNIKIPWLPVPDLSCYNLRAITILSILSLCRVLLALFLWRYFRKRVISWIARNFNGNFSKILGGLVLYVQMVLIIWQCFYCGLDRKSRIWLFFESKGGKKGFFPPYCSVFISFSSSAIHRPKAPTGSLQSILYYDGVFIKVLWTSYNKSQCDYVI